MKPLIKICGINDLNVLDALVAMNGINFLGFIFYKNSPLHDGAVILDGNFNTAARVILPVSENKNINSRLGLRHRAAFGITEKTDAIAIVISEENGKITFIKNGEIFSHKNIEQLKTMIEAELV